MLLRLVWCKSKLTNVAYFLIASQYLSHLRKWFLDLTFRGWLFLLNGFHVLWNLCHPRDLNYLKTEVKNCQRGEREHPLLDPRMRNLSVNLYIRRLRALRRLSKEVSCFEGFKSRSPADSPLCWWTRFTWLVPSTYNTIVLSLSGINLAVDDIWHLIKINVMQLNF